MDYRNNAIVEPNARDISDTRMRCLVKAIAMHGLGLYIYAGEELPGPEVEANQEVVDKTTTEMIELIEADDPAFTVNWDELNREEQSMYWKLLNTKQKTGARGLIDRVRKNEV